jgi:hypothetical protein
MSQFICQITLGVLQLFNYFINYELKHQFVDNFIVKVVALKHFILFFKKKTFCLAKECCSTGFHYKFLQINVIVHIVLTTLTIKI